MNKVQGEKFAEGHYCVVIEKFSGWKLKHFKAIYELQNGLRKQILSVKNAI